jgi:hypothetical protein
MRAGALILVLALASTSNMCGLVKPTAASHAVGRSNLQTSFNLTSRSPDVENSTNGTSAKVDFTTQVRPILQSRCQPCHFSGGVMYQRLPFDRPETIRTLGEKLFTRIKDENDRRIIREFLSQ